MCVVHCVVGYTNTICHVTYRLQFRRRVLAKPFYSFARLAHDTRVHTNPHTIRDKRRGRGRIAMLCPVLSLTPYDNTIRTTLVQVGAGSQWHLSTGNFSARA